MTVRSEKIAIAQAAAPTSCQKVLGEAFSGSASPRKAIKAMCLTCTGFDRETIKNCSAYACPLWLYRPFHQDPK